MRPQDSIAITSLAVITLWIQIQHVDNPSVFYSDLACKRPLDQVSGGNR